MKYGIIDIGSNTMRLNLYQLRTDGQFLSLLSKKSVAGLATYVENSVLSQKGAQKLVTILQNFLQICRSFYIKNVYVFATASVRNIANSQEVLSFAENESKHKIYLLSGEEEAACGYQGLALDYEVRNGYIVDIGGGSTEITVLQEGEICYAKSLHEGSLSIFNQFVSGIVPHRTELKEIKMHIRQLICSYDIPRLPGRAPVYGLGGTMRALGNISQECFGLPDNTHVTKEHLHTLTQAILKEEPCVLRTLLQVSPGRVHTQGPGMLILEAILAQTRSADIYISNKGVREGFLMQHVNGPKQPEEEELLTKNEGDEIAHIEQ